MRQYNDVTFELFEDAIHALYGQEGPDQQRLANEYLIHVWNNCKQSWEYGLRILLRPIQSGQGDPTHIQYFCANMIYGKIRQEWFVLSSTEQNVIQNQMENLLFQIRNGQLGFQQLVLKRICMAMTVLYLATDGGCARCVNECVTSISSVLHIQVALELLTSLCDENDDSYLPPSRKDSLVIEITDASSKVFPFITTIFDTTFATVNETEAMRRGGLTCLKVWIKAAGFSLAKLYTNMPLVFQALLHAFDQPHTSQGVLKEVVLCALILSDALEVSEYPPAASKGSAMAALTSTLLAAQPTLSYYLSHDPHVAHALTTLLGTFGESELDWFVQGSPEALHLTDLMLNLVAQPNRQIATLTFEFWLGLQDYPVASRHVAFQGAIFHRLLQSLVHQCAFRDETDEEDAEDVKSFRLAVAEVLLAIYHLLKASFLIDVGHELDAARGNPAVVEAAMFVLTTIAPELKSRVLQDTQTRELVTTLCRSYIFGHSFFTTIPSIVKAASVFLGYFGPFINGTWTASQDDSMLITSLQYLSFALSISEASSSASKAINQLCATCTTLLIQKDTLISTLFQSMHANIANLTAEDRVLLLEGLVRVTCLAPWAKPALELLLTPLFNRMESPSNPSDLPMELQSLSTILCFMDAPSEEAGGASLTQQVVTWSWPHLIRIATTYSSDGIVRDALFDVFTSALKAKKNDTSFPQSSEFSSILESVQLHAITSPAALQCAITIVELYGSSGSPIHSMLNYIGRQVQLHCQTVPSPSHVPDLMRAYFELTQRSVIFCPASLFEDHLAFLSSLQLAIACLESLNQREALRSVVVYVNSLLSKRETPTLIPYQNIVDGGFQQLKDSLWRSLVLLLTQTCPSTVLSTAITLAFQVLSTYGTSMHAALQSALSTTESALSIDDRMRVYSTWIHMTTNYEERKFIAFTKDYAKVCRKEMPCEQLIDYFVNL